MTDEHPSLSLIRQLEARHKWEQDTLRAEIERLQALVKRYEDEQCATCRAYREIEARRALEHKP